MLALQDTPFVFEYSHHKIKARANACPWATVDNDIYFTPVAAGIKEEKVNSS